MGKVPLWRKGTYLLIGGIYLFFGSVLLRIAKEINFYQWDFKTCFYAGKASRAGLNPYGLTSLAQVAQAPVQFRFRYPPFTLPLFRLLASLKIKISKAYYIFLVAKCLAAAGLILLWMKIFLPGRAGPWFVPFALVAFNGPIFIDLMAGNIAVFEQLVLWGGFAAWRKRRLWLFSLLVLLAAAFKITPLFFLVLLLPLAGRAKFYYFGGSALAFGLIHAVSCFTDPLYKDFLFFNRHLETIGNQSTLQVIKTVVAAAGKALGSTPPSFIALGFFGIIAAGLVSISIAAVRKLHLRQDLEASEKDLLTLFLICMLYALLTPRIAGYNHIILIVPAFFALRKIIPNRGQVLFFFLVSLQIPGYVAAPGLEAPVRFVWDFYSWFISAGLFALYARHILVDDSGRCAG